IPDQFLLLQNALRVLTLRIDIRIIVKYRYHKILRQIFEHIAAAWCTAAVDQKRWDPLFLPELFEQLFKFFLVIYFLYVHLRISCKIYFITTVQAVSRVLPRTTYRNCDGKISDI